MYDFKQHIETYIVDASGDDILLTYVSKKERETIEKYLELHDLA